MLNCGLFSIVLLFSNKNIRFSPELRYLMKQEERNRNTDANKPEPLSGENRPFGILFLGWINFFILGVASLAFFLTLYFNIHSPNSQIVLEEIKKYLPSGNAPEAYFKIAVILQIAISCIFSLSGIGLLLRKEWARKLTLTFSFFITLVLFISVLFRSDLVKSAIGQIIYPGVLIFYLTNKKVQKHFVPVEKKDIPGKGQG